MRHLRALLLRLAGSLGKRRRDSDVAEELEAHLAMHIEDNLRSGMNQEEARRQALIKLGGLEQTKEIYREQQSLPGLETLLLDVRYGLRILRKNPGFAAVVVLTLALGIGASTAVFTVFNAVLLRPLPYRESQDLAVLWSTDKVHGQQRDQVSYTDIEDYRKLNHVFEGISTIQDWYPTVSGSGQPEKIYATAVGADYFQIMRGVPLLGRTFLPEEQQDGKDDVVVLSYRYWQDHFGGDPQIVHRKMVLNTRPHTIVGVMPKDFQSLPTTLVEDVAQLYRPVAEPYDDKARSSRHLRAIARLKADMRWEQAQAEMDHITDSLAKTYPNESSYVGVRVVSLQEDTVGNVRPLLGILMGAVSLLLLIVAANVANLLLTQSTARQKEIAIRTALGRRPRPFSAASAHGEHCAELDRRRVGSVAGNVEHASGNDGGQPRYAAAS